jgi:hypothetical protein
VRGLGTPGVLRETDLSGFAETFACAAPGANLIAVPNPIARRSNCSLQAATAATEAIMIAHGFTIEQMVELVRSCVYRKSDSAILVMKAAKDRP